MRWSSGGRSGDIEDRRGMGGFGFGGGGLRLGFGGIIILLILSVIFKKNFFTLLSTGPTGSPSAVTQRDPQQDAREEPMVQFVSFVLDDTQNTWRQILGPDYRNAKLVLFRDIVQSACGTAQSATGPFYCPGDNRVYIDLSFYDELKQRFGAPGDFAQAYVLAHEIGHHVQDLLGIDEKVRRAQQENPGSANALSVRMELQADCFAGIWGHSTQQRNILESGDVDEALNAASAIGDDRLQRQSTGTVNPDSFTHGTSAQRVEWFRRGFESGKVESCNTFQ
jgi:predicted metalloprotease